MSNVINLDSANVQEIETSVNLSGQKGISVTLYSAGSGASAVSELVDVDLTNITNKSLMIYDEANQVWVLTKELDDHIVDGGEY